MNTAPNSDLTSTIHLTQLRSVSAPVLSLLQQAGEEVLSVLEGLDANSAMLISLIGPNRGARYLIDSDLTSLGRAPENEIFLDDITVSRQHAQIRRMEKEYSLGDAGSLNGTYLNGSLVSQAKLNDGDEVQIGKFRMHFFMGDRKRI